MAPLPPRGYAYGHEPLSVNARTVGLIVSEAGIFQYLDRTRFEVNCA